MHDEADQLLQSGAVHLLCIPVEMLSPLLNHLLGNSRFVLFVQQWQILGSLAVHYRLVA